MTYWSFRLMIGFGSLAALLAAIGLWLTRRRSIPRSRWFYRVALWGLALPYLAAAFGWIFTEMGRQPWTVFGLLTTAQSVSPGVTASSVIISLTVFTLLYAALAAIAGWLTVRHVKDGRPGRGRTARRPGAAARLPVLTGETVMNLATFWFILIAILWSGYFVLEGFDFGVGILLPFLGRDDAERRVHDQHHRPGLGRQRGLAADRRRRDVRRLPALVRHLVQRLLPRRC